MNIPESGHPHPYFYPYTHSFSSLAKQLLHSPVVSHHSVLAPTDTAAPFMPPHPSFFLSKSYPSFQAQQHKEASESNSPLWTRTAPFVVSLCARTALWLALQAGVHLACFLGPPVIPWRQDLLDLPSAPRAAPCTALLQKVLFYWILLLFSTSAERLLPFWWGIPQIPR